MARDLSGTQLRNAIDIDGSYKVSVKADVYPTRIFHETITSNYPVSGADALGMVVDPMRQDIGYSAVGDCLYTFFVDGSFALAYAKQGNSSAVQTIWDTTVKPGVIGSTIWMRVTSLSKRIDSCTIDWNAINSGSTNPFTATYSYIIDEPVSICAVHGVTSTKGVAITSDESGFRPYLLNNGTIRKCPIRFMFPISVKPDADDTDNRDMFQLGIHSAAVLFGTKVYVYISNSRTGMVEGVYYDTENGMWSDIFTVLPTDLQTSMCEFRISNAFVLNNRVYMCGLFNRTDNLDGSQPYSLLLSSTNGKRFCIGRPVIVSNIGYRFLALVANNRLYLGNCNRVCYSDVTWFFNGDTLPSGNMTAITADNIKGFSDSDLSKASLDLRSGLEEYFDHADVVQGALVLVYTGMVTPVGMEYILYGRYIVDNINYELGVGKRSTTLSLVNESLWNLTGLSMPFYAEILGKSILFDAMTDDTANLTPADNGGVAVTKFSVDFWNHVPYSNTSKSITGINMNQEGGVEYFSADADHDYPGTHFLGIMMGKEIKDVIGFVENPKITSTDVTFNVYGWSHPLTTGETDHVHIVMVTEDSDGNEHEHVWNAQGGWNPHWPQSWPDTISGAWPIVETFDSAYYGFAIGDHVKKVGVAFYNAQPSWFNIARIEFISGTTSTYLLDGVTVPWTTSSIINHWTLPKEGKPYIMLAASPYNAFNFSLSAYFTNSCAGTLNAYGYYPGSAGLVGLASDGANYIAGRWDSSNSKVELVVCRDGIERTLKSNPFYIISSLMKIRFEHQGGLFKIYLCDGAEGHTLQLALEYEWKTDDGYMYLSKTISTRCGIYGFKGAPMARTLGFYDSGDENTMNAEAIPFDPAWSSSGFPPSGQIRIGEDIFRYIGLKGAPYYGSRGPYQFRACGDYSDTPGSEYGVELRDFDWNGTELQAWGHIIAFDDGTNHIGNTSLWRIWGSDPDGWLYNRARYFSYNPPLATLSHSLATKVWLVDGLQLAPKPELRVVSGPNGKHVEGDWAVYDRSGDLIMCYWYMGAGGMDDTTVGDMISAVCDYSGAKYAFPGDTTIASLTLSGGVRQSLATIDYSEGYDLYFETAAIASNSITIHANVKMLLEHWPGGTAHLDDTETYVKITGGAGGLFTIGFYTYPDNFEIYSTEFQTNTTSKNKFRIAYLGDHVGIYLNGQWVTTLATPGFEYGSQLVLEIAGYSNQVVSNILVRDICDWREAIYIDLETDGRSALSSVIQQRPIEMIAKPDGSLDFWYEIDRDTITTQREPRQHQYTYSVPTDGSSDAIVYGPKDVVTLQNANFARELGFASKVMRMPDLGIGSIRASKILMNRIFEGYHRHDISTRPDFEPIIGDIYHVHYTADGTGRVECRHIKIESINLSIGISGGKVSSGMSIRGREAYPRIID